MDLKSILKDKDTLDLEKMQRRLILKALIKTNFRRPDAYELNCAGSSYTEHAYNSMVQKHFPMGVLNLRQLYKQQFINRKEKDDL